MRRDFYHRNNRKSDRARTLLSRAVLESLEQRRLLSGGLPAMITPTPNEYNEPDGNFYWVSGNPRVQFDFDGEGDGALPGSITNLLDGQTTNHPDGYLSGSSVSWDVNSPQNGYYEVLLPGAASGGGLATDYSSKFTWLNGDANHDGSVDETDLGIVQGNIDAIADESYSGPFNYATGDFNNDGLIDENDLAAMDYPMHLDAPPTAPNSVVVNSLEDNHATVTWTLPEDNDHLDGVHIYKSNDGVTYTLAATKRRDAATGELPTSWTSDQIPDGSKVWYRIRAFSDVAGNSVASNEDSAVTLLPTPTDLGVSRIGDTTVQLNWSSDATFDALGGIAEVWAEADGAGDWTKLGEAGAGGPFVADSLSPGTSYSFKVRLVTPAQASMYCDETSATTLAEGTPGEVTATPDPDAAAAIVSWIPSGSSVDGYHILRSDNGGGTFDQVADVTGGSEGAWYDDTGITEGQSYQYEVASYTGENPDSGTDNVASVTPLITPGSVIGTSSSDGRSLTVHWTDRSGVEDGYAVYLDGEQVAAAADTGPGATSYTIHDLDPATHYDLDVHTIDGDVDAAGTIDEKTRVPLSGISVTARSNRAGVLGIAPHVANGVSYNVTDGDGLATFDLTVGPQNDFVNVKLSFAVQGMDRFLFDTWALVWPFIP